MQQELKGLLLTFGNMSAHKNGYPWDKSTCAYAIFNGLHYALEKCVDPFFMQDYKDAMITNITKFRELKPVSNKALDVVESVVKPYAQKTDNILK